MKAFTINNKLIKVGNDVIGKTIPFEGIIMDIQGNATQFYLYSYIPACKIWYMDEVIWDSLSSATPDDIRSASGVTFDNLLNVKMLPYNNNNNLVISWSHYLDIKQWGSFSFNELDFQRDVFLSISASDAPIFSQNASIDSIFRYCSDFNSDISHWDVQNVSVADFTFSGALSFNQDLSSWYFPLIASKPETFDYNTPSWVLPKPNFGIPAP